MNLNTVLTVASLVGIILFCIISVLRAQKKSDIIISDEYDSIEKILEGFKKYVVELTKEDIVGAVSEAEFERRYKRKAKITDALKQCTYGVEAAKALVIDLIRDFIDENVKDEHVEKIIGLDAESEPSDHVMFEIIMYRFKRRFGKKALANWIRQNGFDKEHKEVGVGSENRSYYISSSDLQQSYMELNYTLTMDEKRDILSILVYQLFKGFGILDTLREMDINGFNIGTSGSILTSISSDSDTQFRANRSCWLYLDGKYIHLRFMNFGSEGEVKRLVQLIARYNSPGALTAKRGYLVNTMCDKSRVLALRPPASEYWAVFVRKFTLSNVTPEMLIAKPGVTAAFLPLKIIEIAMRGLINSYVTGRQGSGKTTLMTAMIVFIDPRYNIRIIEMAPELYLRELYPKRNILSVAETQHISASQLQDALKKSDSAITLVGEVATDEIALRDIQVRMTGSLMGVSSHHANSTPDLVYTLRNSLVNAGGFDMQTAEKQVVDAVQLDIHLDYTADGFRYISYINEIEKVDTQAEYPEWDPTISPEQNMFELQREKAHRQTDRKSFKVNEIIKFDLETRTYIAVGRPSEALEAEIMKNMSLEQQMDYNAFMNKYFPLRNTENSDVQIDYSGNRAADERLAKRIQAIEDYQENMRVEAEANKGRKAALDEELDALMDFQGSMEVLGSRDSENLEDFFVGLFDEGYSENEVV